MRELKGPRCSKNQYLTHGPDAMGWKELEIGVCGAMETGGWGKSTGRVAAGISEGIMGGEKEAVCWVLSMCVKVTAAGSLLEWGSRSQITGGLRNEGEAQAGKLVFTMV